MQEEDSTPGNFLRNGTMWYVGCHNTSPAVWWELRSMKKIYGAQRKANLFMNNILPAAVYCDHQYKMVTDNQQVSAQKASAICYQDTWVYQRPRNYAFASLSSSSINSDITSKNISTRWKNQSAVAWSQWSIVIFWMQIAKCKKTVKNAILKEFRGYAARFQ